MPFGEGCAEVMAEASMMLEEHNYSPIDFGGYALETQLGEEPDMMLLCHLDVVPEGDGWTKDPYKLTLVGDTVYGRGATDDKGAAVACLYALDALRAVYGEPKTGVRLVWGCGEETGSEDMEYYFSNRSPLKYTLSPDADYPLINIEKGRFAPFFKKQAKNNGEAKLIKLQGGSTQNIVPSKASAVTEGISPEIVKTAASKITDETGVKFSVEAYGQTLTIKADGVSAHAASPEKGNNAQTALIMLLSELPFGNEISETLSSLKALFPHGETNGESVGLKISDDVSGALTLNFGVLSFDGNEFTCGADFRCPVAADDMDIIGIFGEDLTLNGFKYSESPEYRKAHYVPRDSPLVKTCLRVYEEHTGLKGECLAIGGGTYVHEIEGGIAFGIEFPGKDYRIHGADEFADINELLLTAQMYAAVIKELCY